jgi:O-acetyl-ADP-ribose deacetylase (regulator of RNase III)
MSTAWYKSNFVPKLVKQWNHHHHHLRIEVWETTCIVTNFSEAANCSVLINPANPSLSGVSKFSYFPKGGPEPKKLPDKDPHHIMGYVTQWGGMDVGNGMTFSANVVDGLVHQMGGWKLTYELLGKTCAEGQAVLTEAGGQELAEQYPHILHTVPPFYNQTDNFLLNDSYRNSLNLLSKEFPNVDSLRVACPLLGAGCRGFPEDEAIEVAAKTLVDYYSAQSSNKSDLTLAFGIPNGEILEALVQAIDDEHAKYDQATQ